MSGERAPDNADFREDTRGEQRNHVPSKLGGLGTLLTERVQAMPDQTLAQLCQWVSHEHHVLVGTITMWTLTSSIFQPLLLNS